jgi:hypothetical protein
MYSGSLKHRRVPYGCSWLEPASVSHSAQLPPWGKDHRAQRSLSLKVKCHSSADLPICSSDSCPTSPRGILQSTGPLSHNALTLFGRRDLLATRSPTLKWVLCDLIAPHRVLPFLHSSISRCFSAAAKDSALPPFELNFVDVHVGRGATLDELLDTIRSLIHSRTAFVTTNPFRRPQPQAQSTDNFADNMISLLRRFSDKLRNHTRQAVSEMLRTVEVEFGHWLSPKAKM